MIDTNNSFFVQNLSNYKNEIAEIGITALTLPFTIDNSSAFKYYHTSAFVSGCTTLLTEKQIIPQSQEIHLSDQILYHAILYITSQTIFSGIERDLILPFMCSPFLQRFICQQPWFKEAKNIVFEIGYGYAKEKIKQGAIELGKQELKKYFLEYLEKYFIISLIKIIKEDKSKLLENLKRSIQESYWEKMDLLADIGSGGMQTAQNLSTLLEETPQPLFIDRGLKKLEGVGNNFKDLLKVPRISPFQKGAPPSLSSNQLKTFTASCIASYAHPALAPFLFVSSTPDTVELALRISTAIWITQSNEVFFPILALEITNQLIPNFLRKVVTVELLDQGAKRISERGRLAVQYAQHETQAELRNRGYSSTDLKLIAKVTAQVFSSSLFFLLCSENHPIANALGASSFTEYLGIVAQHHGLSDSKNFALENAYLDVFPLHLVTGVALSALEPLLNMPRPLTTLACIAMTSPVVSDSIANLPFYQIRILDKMKAKIIPKYKALRYFGSTYGALSLANNLLAIRIPAFLKITAGLATGGGAFYAGSKILKHPFVIRTFTQMAQFSARTYSRYLFYSNLKYFIGLEAGVMIEYFVKPQTLATAATITTGLVIATYSQNTVYTAVATEVADSFFNYAPIHGRLVAAVDSCWTLIGSLYDKFKMGLAREAALIRQAVE